MKTKRILLIFSWFLYTIINSVTIDIINTVIIVSHLGLLWLHSPIKCLRLQSGSLAYSLLLIESVIENMRIGDADDADNTDDADRDDGICEDS